MTTRGKNGRFKAKFKMGIIHYGGIATALVAICTAFALANGYVIGCNETVSDAKRYPSLARTVFYYDSVFLNRIYQDSIQEAQRMDDLYDSLYDLRSSIEDLQYFKNKNFIVK